MKYLIETKTGCVIKNSYLEAEIFCYFNCIHPEEIFEITDEEAEEILNQR